MFSANFFILGQAGVDTPNAGAGRLLFDYLNTSQLASRVDMGPSAKFHTVFPYFVDGSIIGILFRKEGQSSLGKSLCFGHFHFGDGKIFGYLLINYQFNLRCFLRGKSGRVGEIEPESFSRNVAPLLLDMTSQYITQSLM